MRANISTFMAAMALGVTLGGCGGEPFAYVKVSGKVTYDDGTLIPAGRIRLTFVPQTPPKDPKTVPRPATAEVDVNTGEFKDITSHKFGDGLPPGKHKVLIEALNAQQGPLAVVPREVTDIHTTPLEFDTAAAPWHIVVKKPN